jgi:hypothetical protein
VPSPPPPVDSEPLPVSVAGSVAAEVPDSSAPVSDPPDPVVSVVVLDVAVVLAPDVLVVIVTEDPVVLDELPLVSVEPSPFASPEPSSPHAWSVSKETKKIDRFIG